MKTKVLILLSTYNGEKYLCEQMDSLLRQEEVTANILIRDDGSSDCTINIIKKYQKKWPNIDVYQGDNVGFAKSFWDLVMHANGYEYYAFCDQDDIWYPRKLINAITKIQLVGNDKPILYTGDVVCVDSNGKILPIHPFTGRVLNSYEAFQKSILPGCTFVFNDIAKNLFQKFKGRMFSHDWAAYAITKIFGTVIYDKDPNVFYRLHENNTLGSKSKFQYICTGIKRFFHSSTHVRKYFAYDFYETYSDKIENDVLKKQIYLLGHYQASITNRMRLFFSPYFKGFIFKFYVIIGKI